MQFHGVSLWGILKQKEEVNGGKARICGTIGTFPTTYGT